MSYSTLGSAAGYVIGGYISGGTFSTQGAQIGALLAPSIGGQIRCAA